MLDSRPFGVVYLSGFYAYIWLRDDGTPYYVGKGQKDRAFVSRGHGVHRPKDRSRILIFPRESAQAALATEMELIQNWGRLCNGTGCLRNILAGGNQPPDCTGRRCTPEAIEKTAAAKRGKPRTTELKAKLSAYWLLPENRLKLRLGRLGKRASDEVRAAQSARMSARWVTVRAAKVQAK